MMLGGADSTLLCCCMPGLIPGGGMDMGGLMSRGGRPVTESSTRPCTRTQNYLCVSLFKHLCTSQSRVSQNIDIKYRQLVVKTNEGQITTTTSQI